MLWLPNSIFLFEMGRIGVEPTRHFWPRILRTPNGCSVIPRGGTALNDQVSYTASRRASRSLDFP